MTKFAEQLKKTTEQVKRDTYLMEKYGYISPTLQRRKDIERSHINKVKSYK